MTFRILGMTEESEHVYTALVRNPHSTSTQLAAECRLPVASVGRILPKLVEDGLAARTTGRPPRFTATQPDTAVTTLIREREHELAEARALVHRLAEMHREATRINDPDMAVELLANRDDVSAAARRLTAVAQRQVRAFDRPPYVDRPGSNLDGQIQRQRDGVAHRVVYDRTAVAWPGRLHADIIPSMRTGELARVHPELPLKLVIADDRAAIIPFSLAPGGQAAAYLVHPSPLLVALESLFEAYWERATPIPQAESEQPGGRGPGRSAGADEGTRADTSGNDHGCGAAAGIGDSARTGIAPKDRRIAAAGEPEEDFRVLLVLLAAGLTDAAIARAQGWSERTTQRRVQQLLSNLGAVTRFQAGLIAARRGWL